MSVFLFVCCVTIYLGLLGKEQFAWLIQNLKERRDKADVSVFVSGIQILNRYRSLFAETWGDYFDYDLFLNVLLEINVNNPILVSGDVHHGSHTPFTFFFFVKIFFFFCVFAYFLHVFLFFLIFFFFFWLLWFHKKNFKKKHS